MSIDMVIWIVVSAVASVVALCFWLDGASKGKW